MALNTRSAIDPRWAFAHRDVARGAMLCIGVILRPSANTEAWQPLAANPDLRVPRAVRDYEELYRGPARVQPGQDFRSRQQNLRDETVTENTVRVQLDMRQNSLAAGVFPAIQVNDVFRVTEVLVLDGVAVDSRLLSQILIVRTISTSSNSWVCNLLCSVDLNKVVDIYA